LLVANGLDNINAGFGQISSFEYQPAYLESGIYWAAGDGPMGQSIYIGTQLGIGFIPGRPLWPNQPNRTPIPEPDIPPGSAPITLPKNLPKNFPGQLPNGSKLSEFGENYFVLEYPDGTKTIRFKACEAKQVRQPVKGEPSGTPETLASLNSEGDVVVQEGLHRLNAVAVDGASVADSVQGATGWLEYNYGGKVDLIGEGIGWGPPLNKPNPVPNLPWHGEGYDW
jgi:hypothetical protein